MKVIEKSLLPDKTAVLLEDETDGLGASLHIVAFPKAKRSFEGIKEGERFRVELSNELDTKTTRSIYNMLIKGEIDLKDIAVWFVNDRIVRHCLML